MQRHRDGNYPANGIEAGDGLKRGHTTFQSELRCCQQDGLSGRRAHPFVRNSDDKLRFFGRGLAMQVDLQRHIGQAAARECRNRSSIQLSGNHGFGVEPHFE